VPLTETPVELINCPAPPPPPIPAPPAPPPPITNTSALVTPAGTLQLQIVKFAKVKIVNPLTTCEVGVQAGLLIANEKVAVEVPLEFVAVIVYVVLARVAVGVPDKTPVLVLKARSALAVKAGLIEYEDAGPPVFVIE
jgi:hypothetical protein